MAFRPYNEDSSAFYSYQRDNSDEDDEDDDDNSDGQIIVGICAMAKKSQSKPMNEILHRLARFRHLKPIVFPEDVILHQPVENWPLCDCLISYHSKGFPLDKAMQYAELRKPLIINDISMQYKLQDRLSVHSILAEMGIDQPRYMVLDRQVLESDGAENKLLEMDDSIEYNGQVFHKPFVEKPISAEDHNVFIYFPGSAGGGSQRLFRKIGNRSSVYSPVSAVRKNGSFLYEEFMPTDGTDVKVYTVGTEYAHAEARKSPALDGKVERDFNGKEVRYPVILTAREKLIARLVVMAFKQMVCGFDLLRANGRSYVCDVNGFSLVKSSPKYYDDCAKILGNHILRNLAPQLHIPYSSKYQPEDIPIVPTTAGTMMELRSVVGVIRHGDRTPKQKMKMEVRHRKFLDLFERYGGYQKGRLKLKKPQELQEVLDIARGLLVEAKLHNDPELEEKKPKLEQMKAVLEMHGYFSGINRKLQMKYQPQGSPRSSSSDGEGVKGPSVVVILKWGGELTPAGKIQAEEMGKAFRAIYPGGQGQGFLRLHSTFRHDLKIYASDEGRVQMTAAAFTKGMLSLEGELPPILAQMVKCANMNGLLDKDNGSIKFQNVVKERLQELLNVDHILTDDDMQRIVPTGAASLKKAVNFVGNPRLTCARMFTIMQHFMEHIKELRNDKKSKGIRLYAGESWELMVRRWSKLVKDFRVKNDNFDISKVPDIYDCIKYDVQHNMKVLNFPEAEELHALSKSIADVVVPQEYGITKEEKLVIAQCICTPLLKKILGDVQHHEDESTTRLDFRYSEGVLTPHRFVRTRLYFTSESHIHSLVNVLRYGGFCDINKDKQWARAMEYVNGVSELNYMSQLIIMTYEDPTKDFASEDRFHVEVHFSPGAYNVGQERPAASWMGYRSQVAERKSQKQETLQSVSSIENMVVLPTIVDASGPLTPPIDTASVKSPFHITAHEATKVTWQLDKADMASSTAHFTSPADSVDTSQTAHPAATSAAALPQNANENRIGETFPSVEIQSKVSNEDMIVTSPSADCLHNIPVSASTMLMDKTVLQLPLGVDKMKLHFNEAEEVSGIISLNGCNKVEEMQLSSSQDVENTICSSDDSLANNKLVEGSVAVTQDQRTCSICQVESLAVKEFLDGDKKKTPDATVSKPLDIPNINRQRHASDGNVTKAAVGSDEEENKTLDDKTGRPQSLEDMMGAELMVEFAKLAPGQRCRSVDDDIRINTVVLNKKKAGRKRLKENRITFFDIFPRNQFQEYKGVDIWCVKGIHPLETLHNALTLQHLESFLQRITENYFSTPLSSPSRGPTPTPQPGVPQTYSIPHMPAGASTVPVDTGRSVSPCPISIESDVQQLVTNKETSTLLTIPKPFTESANSLSSDTRSDDNAC